MATCIRSTHNHITLTMADIIRVINDPEHPLTLEQLNVVENSKVKVSWLVGLLVVFCVPLSARSFRDGTPIYCPLGRT